MTTLTRWGRAIALGVCTAATACGSGAIQPGSAPDRPGSAASGCTRDGWCRELPRGFGGSVADLWTADDRVVSVGEGGFVGTLREGGVWRFEHTGHQEDLRAVSGRGERLTAIGRAGLILQTRGQGWSQVASPTDSDLTAVWSDGVTVLVAARGRIWRQRDGRWTELPSMPGAEWLHAVWSPDGEEVWAGGEGSGPFQLVGGAWKNHYFGSVTAIAGQRGAVFFATSHGLHRVDAQGLRSVAEGDWSDVAVGPEGVVALGREGILRVRGEDVAITKLEQPFSELAVTKTGKIILGGRALAEALPDGSLSVAAGDSAGPDPLAGARTLLEGTAHPVTLQASGYPRLQAVWGFDDGRVFAAGDEGGVYLGRPSATGQRDWSLVRYSGDRLEDFKSIWGPSSDRVFIVGWNRSSTEYAGTTWKDVAVPTADGVWGFGNNLAYAVWREAAHRWDGRQWTKLDAPGVGGSSVWGSAPDDVWIVSPGIWHFDGKTWTEIKGAVDASAIAVWGRGRDDVYVATGQGVQHFDGSAWRYTPLTKMGAQCAKLVGRDTSLYAIAGNARGVWAVGQHGLIATNDGGAWHCELSGTRNLMQGVWAGNRAVFAACGDGVLRKDL